MGARKLNRLLMPIMKKGFGSRLQRICCYGLLVLLWMLWVAGVLGYAANPSETPKGSEKPLVTLDSVGETRDRAVLRILYKACGGMHWIRSDGWATDAPLSQWYGVQVDATGQVVALDLAYNNLLGSMPEELGRLEGLSRLDLSHNRLYGEIPEQIGQLKHLRTLSLAHNELSGALPTTIGALTELQYLALYHNRFSGLLPDSFANLKALQELYL